MASKTREKLIEVARQLFAHKGVAGTTMSDIANASTKGRRTIYTYFRNKQEIYNAVLEEESERLVDALREVYESDVPIERRLRNYLRKRLERYVTPTSTSTMVNWLKFDSRRLAKVQSMARDKDNAMLASLLAEGCERGVFRPDRCALVKEFIHIAVAALDLQPLRPDNLEERKRAIVAFTEFLISDISA